MTAEVVASDWPSASVPADLWPADRLTPWLTAGQAGWLALALAALGPGVLHPGPELAAGAPVATLAVAGGWAAPGGRPLFSWIRPVAGWLWRRLR